MKLKTFLMNGYGIARTTPGLFAPVLDRHGKPAKLQVLSSKKVVKLIQDRRSAGMALGAPITPDEYRKRFGRGDGT